MNRAAVSVVVKRLAVVLAASVVACRHPSHDGADAVDSSVAPASDPTPAAAYDVLLDVLDPSPRCRIEHRGALVDLGSSEAAWSTPGHPDPSSTFPGFERDGATWGRVLDRKQSFVVAIDASGAALVSVRGRARAAKKAVASVDGKSVGTLVLSPTADSVVTISNPSVALSPGLHTVSLRWVGGAAKDEALAELDWLRLGVVDDDPSAYAAPTRRDALAQIEIGGAPRSAYVLRAPATIRCVAWVPPGAKLLGDVGAIGEGSDGAIEVRERETGSAAPRVITSVTATSSAWHPIVAPLTIGGESGAIGVFEIVVTRAPKQGRVAIAEPRLVRERPASPLLQAPPPQPRRAIVVVMAALAPSRLDAPVYRRLAQEGVVFRAHRAPSLLASASVASLVTGLPVPVHALDDGGARLSPRTPLLATRLAPFGVESSMFTEAPPTGPAFGFAHDWAHFAARSPLDGAPAAFDEITAFLAATTGKKALLVAHARGAHPPWDVAASALKTLPPDGYSGMVDPHRVIALLAKVRRGLVHLTDADRARLLALQDVASSNQETRLATLLDAMKASGALDDTLLVVTGDAPFPMFPASSERKPSDDATAPHVDDDPSAIPLLVRFPGAFAAGHVVGAVTDPTDVAATIVAGFGASIADLAGRDLAALALDDGRARDTARLLDDGHGYQLVWGDLRLVGGWEKTPALHAHGADDVKSKRPFEYLAAWALAADARDRWLADRAKGPGREPATIDPQTATALDAWERAK